MILTTGQLAFKLNEEFKKGYEAARTELLEPMSCGHAKALLIPDRRTESCDKPRHAMGYQVCPGCILGFCSACAALDAKGGQ